MTTAAHSRSPTLAEVLRAAINTRLADVHVALPGSIERYDPATQKADVKPLLMRRLVTAEGGELVEALPVITDVPVAFPRSGQFFVSLPLQPGDHVLLVFTDQSLDNFMLGTGADTDPDDFRTHDLSDAVALPGFFPFAKALTTAHAANLVLGKDAGPQIHVDATLVHLGEFPGAEFVALATKTNDRIAAVEDKLNALITKFNTHAHPGVTSGPASTGPTPAQETALAPGSPVDATKVKAS